MDFQTLALELQKRALDLAQQKRPVSRYEEALNRAIALYPMILWPFEIDGSTLDTVKDQQEYDLSEISGLTTPAQVVRVWIDDSEDVRREIGRYEVWDNAGSLTLFLDEAPDDAYDITLEFHVAPSALSGPTDTTEVDDEWLLTRAMLLLLYEADLTAEDPQAIAMALQSWTAQLAQREMILFRQRTRRVRRARTTAWRSYVT